MPNDPYRQRKVKPQSDYMWEIIMGGALISIVFILALVASPSIT